MAQKVAEQVVDMLVDTGVKRIYAVTGDSLNEINDAVRRNEKIDYLKTFFVLNISYLLILIVFATIIM